MSNSSLEDKCFLRYKNLVFYSNIKFDLERSDHFAVAGYYLVNYPNSPIKGIQKDLNGLLISKQKAKVVSSLLRCSERQMEARF